MEIKEGDLLKRRYIVNTIMLTFERGKQEFCFILYDKKEDKYVAFFEEDMKELLGIKE